MFAIEILVEKEGLVGWLKMKPSGPTLPYSFETWDEADKVRRMCYGDILYTGRARIIEVEPPPASVAW